MALCAGRRVLAVCRAACTYCVQGGAAGVSLGLLSLAVTGGCAAYLAARRRRVEFSVQLLQTVRPVS